MLKRVHAGVGAAASDDTVRRPEYARERIFQGALDSSAVRLPLPTLEIRAVKLQIDPERARLSDFLQTHTRRCLEEGMFSALRYLVTVRRAISSP